MKRIYFYGHSKGDYKEFSNFFPQKVVIDKQEWPTTEHYFQACKFHDEKYRETIRNASNPAKAKALGRSRSVKLRSDWEKVKIPVMVKALVYKFSIPEMQKVLFNVPDDTLIVEHTSNDRVWADGGDGSGKNYLGKILTVVRYVLKHGDCSRMSDELKKAVRC